MIWTNFLTRNAIAFLVFFTSLTVNHTGVVYAQTGNPYNFYDGAFDLHPDYSADSVDQNLGSTVQFIKPIFSGFYPKYPFGIKPLSKPDPSFFYWYSKPDVFEYYPTHRQLREYCSKTVSGNTAALKLFYGAPINFSVPTTYQGCFINNISPPNLPEYSSNVVDEIASRIVYLKQNISLINVLSNFEARLSKAMVALQNGEKMPDLRGMEEDIWYMEACSYSHFGEARDSWAVVGLIGMETFETRRNKYLIDKDLEAFALRKLVTDLDFSQFEGALEFLCVSDPKEFSESTIAGQIGDNFYYGSQASWDRYQENPLKLFTEIEASLVSVIKERESLQNAEIVIRSNLSLGKSMLDFETEANMSSIKGSQDQIISRKDEINDIRQETNALRLELVTSEERGVLLRRELEDTQENIVEIQTRELELNQTIETTYNQLDQIVVEIGDSILDIEKLFKECGDDIFSMCNWHGTIAQVGTHEEKILAARGAAILKLEVLKSELEGAVIDLSNSLEALHIARDRKNRLQDDLLHFVSVELPAIRENSLVKEAEAAASIKSIEDQISKLQSDIVSREAVILKNSMILSELANLGIEAPN